MSTARKAVILSRTVTFTRPDGTKEIHTFKSPTNKQKPTYAHRSTTRAHRHSASQ